MSKRLDEIEKSYIENTNFTAIPDMVYLINRVKKLEAVLEEISDVRSAMRKDDLRNCSYADYELRALARKALSEGESE